MFLACEEKPSQFWSKNLLVKSVCELLIEMMKWVKLKFCVNYFIPGTCRPTCNNMMDHLIDTDLSYEIDALQKASQSYQLICDILNTCRLHEFRSSNIASLMRIESPSWVKRAFVIYINV